MRLNHNSNSGDGTLPGGGIPKYLELIYDEEEGDQGYEIPRPPPSITTPCESPSEQIPLVQSESVNEEIVSSLDKLLPMTKCNGLSYSNMNKPVSVLDKVSLTLNSSEARNTSDLHR